MKRFICIFFLMTVFLTGCGATDGKDVQNEKIPDNQRLMVYTAYAEEVYRPLVNEFEERFGLWVDVRQGGTLELLEELEQEDRTFVGDVFLGGSIILLEERKDWFDTIEEHSCTPIVLVYNPKLVKNTPPEGWEDLLLPVWKGEIAFADPMKSGSAYLALNAITKVLPGEEEVLRQQFLENLDGNYLDFSRDVVREVANGNFYIGVTLEETALRSIDAGFDISVVYPEKEVLLTEGIAILAESKQKKNAALFMEFMQSTDVKKYMEEHLYRYIPREVAE